LGTQNIILCWRGRSFAFAANLGAEEPLVELLRFFQRRAIALTERARSIVAKRATIS
jgi:hypothetical protein